jgi:hypothetical protein
MKGEQRGKCGGDQWLIKSQTGGEERGRDVQQRPCGGRSGERGGGPAGTRGGEGSRSGPRPAHGGHGRHCYTRHKTGEGGNADMWAPRPQ